MKIFLWTVLFIAMMGAIASARIGETLEECDQRYGERTKAELTEDGSGTVYYHKNDLNILIHIYAGRCDLIRYQPGGPLVHIDLEVAEYLRNINGRSKGWVASRPGMTPTPPANNKDDDKKNSSGASNRKNNDKSAKSKKPSIIDNRPAKSNYWITTDGLLEATFSASSGVLEIKSVRGSILMKNMIVEGL